MFKVNKIDNAVHFTNGWVLEDFHYQDCCEAVYADWSSLRDTDIMGREFEEIIFEEYEGGFRFNGYAVNCYNSQNGYYSDNLEIYLKDEKGNIIKTFEPDKIDEIF